MIVTSMMRARFAVVTTRRPGLLLNDVSQAPPAHVTLADKAKFLGWRTDPISTVVRSILGASGEEP